jgi:hypothetical protein
MGWKPLLIGSLLLPAVSISNPRIRDDFIGLNFVKENYVYDSTIINYIFDGLF